MRAFIETADPRETTADRLKQLDEPDTPTLVVAEPPLGQPPPYAMLSCRHPGRTVYVVLGLFGAYCVRLCRKPERGYGWHGHGEILRQWWTTSGALALEVVAVLSQTSHPEALVDALEAETTAAHEAAASERFHVIQLPSERGGSPNKVAP